MSGAIPCDAWDTFDADHNPTSGPRCRYVRPCTRDATVEVPSEDGPPYKLCDEHAGGHPGGRPLRV